MQKMKLDKLLSRLDGVKPRSNGGYLAKCPSHHDRSPSLSLAERDGRILLKCFAGCGADDIVSAVGMTLSDLMPDNPEYSRSMAISKSHGYKHEWFDKLLYESSLLAIFLEDAVRLGDLYACPEPDFARVVQAISTIGEIRRSYAGR
jgi:hypothetical protein